MNPRPITASRAVYYRLVQLVKLGGDFFLLCLSTVVVFFARENVFGFDFFRAEPAAFLFVNFYLSLGTVLKVAVIYATLGIAVFVYRGLYSRYRTAARLDELYNVMKSLIIVAFLMMAVSILLPQLPYNRAAVVGNFIVSLALIDAWRIASRKAVGFLARRGVGMVRVLIYGAGTTGRLLAHQVKLHPEFGYEVVGFVDDDPAKIGKTYEGNSVLGNYQQLPSLLVDYNIDEVIVAIPSAPHRDLLNVVFDLRERRIHFQVVADLFELVTRRVTVNQIGSIPLLRLWREPLDGWQGHLKRLLDVVAAALGIVLLLPLWLIIMALIKIDSRGPVFYRQERVGKGGRRFRIYKFRSMVAGADELLPELAQFNEMDGPIFKMKNDPRITRVGKWLRRFSLDELPQLLNVLKGDMSLVGPRPPLPHEAEQYERWQMKRLTVPQGVTGLWQVSGRNLLTFEEMVRLDIYYIENWSLWLDLKILLKTIPVVLLMRGAY